MIATTALLLVLFAGQAPSPQFDGPRFVKAIQGLHAEIEDVSLICEGRHDYVGPMKLIAPRTEWPNDTFQENYLYRGDGASLIEAYVRSGLRPKSPLSIRRMSTLGGQLQRHHVNPDARAPLKIINSRGGSAAFAMPKSAALIVQLWYFQRLSAEKPPKLSEEAWELVDGQRCLRIRIDTDPDSYPGDKHPSHRFWIDMARGGHPLKYEWLEGESARLRAHDIRLESFPRPGGGREIWFPVSAVVDTFCWGGQIYAEPIFQEHYGVVAGSLKINQRLSDRAFRLETASETTGSPFLAGARQAFRAETERIAREPSEPIDPKSVQERLDRELAEADRQSRMLNASSTASGPRNWASLLPTALGIVGIALIVGVAAWKVKSR